MRAGLGEEFGFPIGTPVTGKMAAALRRLGFDKTFDTDTGADLTIMEEANELLERIQNGGKLPMITSCSPGWIKFCEHNFPDFLDNLSSCKSPHEMFGAVIKSYYAKKNNIDPKKIFVVSVMPCVAKKFEAGRPEMESDGLRDVDAVISTRELARMIKNISFDDFKNVKQQAKGRENVAKERAKAVIGLYLTVMYLLVKNLVNVNARYVIAIHCLERDFGLYKEIIPELASKNLKNDYRILSQTLCELCDNRDESPNLFLKKNKRLRKCVEVDINNADSSMTRKYRNCIAHLTVVRELKEYIGDIRTVDSYFSIYHYVMQRCITKREDDKKQEEKIKFEDDLLKNHGYTKDFVKALNSPFGYNIPRFKNLSIEQLFDRNEYLTEK